MFRIDDNLVIDATMKGNAARFINHSCDVSTFPLNFLHEFRFFELQESFNLQPNCYSKVVEILGHKHIIIFALRRIYCREELTYDYKFPFEEDKIPCTCGARKCRKFLNWYTRHLFNYVCPSSAWDSILWLPTASPSAIPFDDLIFKATNSIF